MQQSDTLSLEIARKAQQLAHFSLPDGTSCGIELAAQRLQEWCANFERFGIDRELLAPLIRDIRFIGDQQVIDGSIALLKKLMPEIETVAYCPFGDDDESSARIMRTLNATQQLFPSLHALLTRCQSEEVPRAIVFIDDALNTGGQFRRVVTKWFSDDRLDSQKRSILQQVRLIFLFANGTEEGRLSAQTCLHENKLNGSIHILMQHSNQTCFGTADDIAAIRHTSEHTVQNGPFAGFQAASIQPLYELCHSVGYQTLLATKPDWDEEKRLKRCLGYGNEGKMIVGQNNLPTCTLTCLWSGGRVSYQGIEHDWQPLFSRRPKKSAPEVAGPLFLPPADGETPILHLDRDLQKTSAAPLEIILIYAVQGAHPITIEKLDNYLFLDRHLPDTMMKSLFGGEEPLLQVHRLSPALYAEVNNHLMLNEKDLDTPLLPVFIKHFDLIQTPLSRLFSIRLQFKAQGITLPDAQIIAHRLRVHISSTKTKGNFQRCRGRQNDPVKDSIISILDHIVEKAAPGDRLIRTTPRIMCFIRLEEGSFDTPGFSQRVKQLATLTNPNNHRRESVPECTFVELNKACMTANEIGTLMLCEAGLPVNRNGLQDEFASAYYAQELLIATMTAALSSSSAWGPRLENLLSKLLTPAVMPNQHLRGHLRMLMNSKGITP